MVELVITNAGNEAQFTFVRGHSGRHLDQGGIGKDHEGGNAGAVGYLFAQDTQFFEERRVMGAPRSQPGLPWCFPDGIALHAEHDRNFSSQDRASAGGKAQGPIPGEILDKITQVEELAEYVFPVGSR